MPNPNGTHAQTLRRDTIKRRVLGDVFRKRLKQLKLSNVEAGAICDEAATQISRVKTKHDEEFSAERYAKHLNSLAVDIDIAIRPRPVANGKPARGRTRIVVLPETDRV